MAREKERVSTMYVSHHGVNLFLEEQESSGDYVFWPPKRFVATRSLVDVLKEKTAGVCFAALQLIQKTFKYPDYLQTLVVKEGDTEIKFWIIHDDECITALLPEDY